MVTKIEMNECLCSFVDLLMDFKTTFASLIDGLIALLSVLKTYLQLFNVSLEDQARKYAGQYALAILEQAVIPIEMPFQIILSYTNVMADCDPVASLAATLKSVRDEVLKPVKDKQYEIQQMLNAIEAKDNKIKWIERTINVLKEIKDAINECQNPPSAP